MLKRWGEYERDNPVQAWLVTAGMALAFSLAVSRALTGGANPALFLLMASGSLGGATVGLARRFSDGEPPVPPRQEAAVGALALALAAVGLAAWAGPVLARRLVGLSLPTDARMWLVTLLLVAWPLSVVLGHAARRSRAGAWGLKLSLGWAALLCCLLFLAEIRRLFAGGRPLTGAGTGTLREARRGDGRTGRRSAMTHYAG